MHCAACVSAPREAPKPVQQTETPIGDPFNASFNYPSYQDNTDNDKALKKQTPSTVASSSSSNFNKIIFQKLIEKNFSEVVNLLNENPQNGLEIEKEFTLLHILARISTSGLTEEENNLIIQIAIKLIELGVNINSQSENYSTAIHYAVKSQNLNLLQLLISSGGNIHKETSNGKSAIYYASKLKDLKFFNELNVHKPDLFITTLNSQSTSFHAAIEAENFEIVQHIVNQFIEKNTKLKPNYDIMPLFGVIRKKDNSTPLFLACSVGNFEIFEFLCNTFQEYLKMMTKYSPIITNIPITIDPFFFTDKGIHTQFYFYNSAGKSPLYMACVKKHYKIVHYLLYNNVNFDINRYWKVKTMLTPLFGACYGGSVEITQLLIDFIKEKFPAKLANYLQITFAVAFNLLSAAISSENLELVKLIYNYNIKGDEESLIICGSRNYFEIAKFLLENQICDVNKIRTKDNLTPLYVAAQNNHLEMVKLFIKHGADYKIALYEKKYTPLFIACQKGWLEIVKFFLEDTIIANNVGKEILLNNNIQTPPIVIAVEKNQMDVVVYLIEKGAKIDYIHNNKNILASACISGNMELIIMLEGLLKNILPDQKIYLPICMYTAASQGHTHVIRYLHGKGVSCDHLYETGKFSSFYIAAQNGHFETIKYINEITNGKFINIWSEVGASPLYIACQKGHLNIVEYLLNNGADYNHLFKGNYSALLVAIQFNFIEIINLLLNFTNNRIANITTTPIYYAVTLEKIEPLKLLIERGMDFQKEVNGFTPFYLACQKGNIEIVLLLIQYGVNPFHYCKLKNTPLHIAITKEHENVVRTLLSVPYQSLESFVNATNEGGSSALNIAVSKGNFYLTKLLIEFGADYRYISKGRNLLYISLFQPRLELLDYIISHLKISGVNDRLNEGRFTPLSLAAQLGNIPFAQYLLFNGANVNGTNSDGGFPLYLASQNGKLEMVKYLLSKGADPSQKFRLVNTCRMIANTRGFANVVALLDNFKK